MSSVNRVCIGKFVGEEILCYSFLSHLLLFLSEGYSYMIYLLFCTAQQIIAKNYTVKTNTVLPFKLAPGKDSIDTFILKQEINTKRVLLTKIRRTSYNHNYETYFATCGPVTLTISI